MIYGVIIEMCSDCCGLRIVCGMLNRRKGVYVLTQRKDDDSAGAVHHCHERGPVGGLSVRAVYLHFRLVAVHDDSSGNQQTEAS